MRSGGAVGRGGDPGRHGRCCRRCHAGSRRGYTGHGCRCRRVPGIVLRTGQRRPLGGAGFDRAQRVVHARRRRDRRGRFLRPRIERCTRRRWLRRATSCRIGWQAGRTGTCGGTYRRALRLRGGRPRRDRGTRRGRLQCGGGRPRGSRPRAHRLESGRKRGRIGARDLRVRGCAREAGGAAGRRRRHRGGRCDRRGRCRHAALGCGRFQPARWRDRFHVRARRRAAARLRPRLRVGFPQRRARIPAILARRHRIDGMRGGRLDDVVVAMQRAARQVGDAARFVITAVIRTIITVIAAIATVIAVIMVIAITNIQVSPRGFQKKLPIISYKYT